VDDIARGRLRDPGVAPEIDESIEAVARVGDVVVEQILSGRLVGPVDYPGDVDEWVVVLAGRAQLEVAGTRLTLDPGDWMLLPAGTPHRLVETEPGTSWLTITDRA
jgi:mannose-6-phosphate isomerase-like protein (cupin superfamily)